MDVPIYTQPTRVIPDFSGYVHPVYVHADTEFLSYDLTDGGFVSAGLVTKHASYYAVNADMNFDEIFRSGKNARWMSDNVLPHLPTIPHPVFGDILDTEHPDVKPYRIISSEVNQFLKAVTPTEDADDMEIIVKSGSQDMVRLHTLLSDNDWAQHGPWVPQYADDIARIKRRACYLGLDKDELPVQDASTLHHALWDAEHEMRVHDYLLDRFGLI